jgi:hypothetical protein
MSWARSHPVTIEFIAEVQMSGAEVGWAGWAGDLADRALNASREERLRRHGPDARV